MKAFRLLLALSLLFVWCGFAYGDVLPPGDPRMVVNDPICDSELPCAPLVVPGQEFTFTAGADGNTATPGSFQVAGSGFFNLDIETFGAIPPNLVDCTSDKFTCTVTDLGNVTDMFFHIPTCGFELECPPGGFPVGDVFTISLLGWQPEQVFFAVANLDAQPTSARISTPEPSVFLLFGSGAVALFGRRKKLIR